VPQFDIVLPEFTVALQRRQSHKARAGSRDHGHRRKTK
jgi:hypothetical protein